MLSKNVSPCLQLVIEPLTSQKLQQIMDHFALRINHNDIQSKLIVSFRLKDLYCLFALPQIIPTITC